MYERLRSAHPNMTVYKKQDIPERYHIKHHYRVPPLYLLADEGYAIAWVSRSVFRAGLRLCRALGQNILRGPIAHVIQTSLSCRRVTRATCCIKECSHRTN